ncbi:MAG: radical SAM protein [Bacteroidota bacterium]
MGAHQLSAEAITAIPKESQTKFSHKLSTEVTISSNYDMQIVTGIQRRFIDAKVGFHILRLAIKNYRSLSRSVKVLKALLSFKKSVLGRIETKLIKVGGKFYHTIYAPGYPSKNFDSYIESEFNRVEPLEKKTKALNFIFFAITSKCPLRCEHCFEWDNLNSKETFTLAELKAVVAKFQEDGISQFHCSGGEPMVRVKDLVQLISGAAAQSDFHVLTSGYNFTAENARLLKQAGLTGVVISLDHYDGEMHNAFRGFKNSFNDVLIAIRNAQEQNLLITLSLCATKTFISWDNLMRYAELAKKLEVAFIQVLEPKAVGHYAGKDVFLNEDHFKLLDKFYFELNFSPAYKQYPVLLYHGYHQRRIGCLSGGSRNLYIDSKGYVNACPFCHTKSFNIKDSLALDNRIQKELIKPGCVQYNPA